jgi:HK97 family phage major capsid protein
MESVLRGTPVAAEYRDDTFTAVADAAAVIPTTIMNEVIKEMKVRGQIYSRCRPTNVPGGVRYPILSLKPVATRVTEGAVSERQKIQMNTYISFGYLILECRVATSLLASAVTLAMFEAQIVPLIVEAMTTTNEYEVFNGNGTTEMLGILVDDRVKAAQKITLSSAEFGDWAAWKKKVFAKVPLAYRSYEIFMGAGTFEGYIDGMVDANGQPIGRTNYGITDGTIYRFGGKNVVEVEEDVIKSYDNADVGDVVAVFVDLGEYAINSNMQMAMYRWFDHDTNQWVDKAILINDGKLLDAAGVIIVKKG